MKSPHFIEKLKPVSAQDGSTTQFECIIEGTPRPVVTWFRQTAIIKPSPDFQVRQKPPIAEYFFTKFTKTSRIKYQRGGRSRL